MLLLLLLVAVAVLLLWEGGRKGVVTCHCQPLQLLLVAVLPVVATGLGVVPMVEAVHLEEHLQYSASMY
jgi:hypothetical protein